MAVKFGDTLSTREAVVAAALDTLETKANEASQTIEGGPLDGISVISLDRLRGLVLEVRSIDLPPPSEKYAEVTTPAEIKVTMPCPECGQPAVSTLHVHPQLIVESNVRKIKVKGKAEPVVHMHGQLALREGLDQIPVDEVLEAIGELDDLRLRVLRAVADVSDAWASDFDQGPPPSLEAIAAKLELATDSDRGDLEESLYAYSQADPGLVEIVPAGDVPTVTYVLTDAGIELLADADRQDELEAEDDDPAEDDE